MMVATYILVIFLGPPRDTRPYYDANQNNNFDFIDITTGI